MQSVIQDKFRTTTYNAIGYYEIVLFIDGQWQIVIVDDHFPYNTNLGRFAFAHSTNHTIWLMLLEKAWAKVNGGYSNIIGGSNRDPLEALTSFPSQVIELEKENEFEQLYQKVEIALNKGSIITIGTLERKESVKKLNLSAPHCYSIIGVNCWKEKIIYLFVLIDPRGQTDYCIDCRNQTITGHKK